MVETMPRRFRQRRANPIRHTKALLLILFIVAVPSVSGVLLVHLSARPSFEQKVFSPADCGGDLVVNWRMLMEHDNPGASLINFPAELLAPTVCVPGYMLQFTESPDERGNVSEFMLVPDPGNW